MILPRLHDRHFTPWAFFGFLFFLFPHLIYIKLVAHRDVVDVPYADSLLLPDIPPPPKARYVMTPGGSRQRLVAPTTKYDILPLKQPSGSVHPQSSSPLSHVPHIFLSSLWVIISQSYFQVAASPL